MIEAWDLKNGCDIKEGWEGWDGVTPCHEMIYRQEHLQPLGDKKTQDELKKELERDAEYCVEQSK